MLFFLNLFESNNISSKNKKSNKNDFEVYEKEVIVNKKKIKLIFIRDKKTKKETSLVSLLNKNKKK